MDVDAKIVGELEQMAPGRVLAAEPMARHTSFGLGGPADLFVEPPDPRALRDCVALLSDRGIPIIMLGRGTNILVRSGGLEGAVVATERALRRLDLTDDGVVSEAGTALSQLLHFCSERGLSGLEGLAGIPGSVGGALVTNAGSFGVSIGDRLLYVLVFRPGGESTRLDASELKLEYRRTSLPAGAIIEHVCLLLDTSDPEKVAGRQKEVLEAKWKSQPVGMRSAGCVFRNPPDQSAGKLIDTCGLKGTRVGGAVVSDIHANYILNDRGATAEDVEELIDIIRRRVRSEANVDLELEIEILGRSAQ